MTKRKSQPRGAQPANENAVKHGIYSNNFTDAELSRIIAPLLGEAATLTPEIEATRVLFDRSLSKLNKRGLDTSDFVLLAQLNLQTSGRIAMLLRNQAVLDGTAHDNLAGHVADALSELSTIFHAEL